MVALWSRNGKVDQTIYRQDLWEVYLKADENLAAVSVAPPWSSLTSVARIRSDDIQDIDDASKTEFVLFGAALVQDSNSAPVFYELLDVIQTGDFPTAERIGLSLDNHELVVEKEQGAR